MWDYSEAYIVVKGTKTVAVTNGNNGTNEMLTFKNNDPFRSCITKLNSTFIDNAGLNIAMSMYNLLEYCDNYSLTSRSLWIYYRDEINDDANESSANN